MAQSMPTENLPCFVVSLPDSPRRKAVVKNLAKVGITNPIFHDAVNGRNLTPEQLKPFEESKRRYWFHRTIQKGAMGCSLSHIGIYQKMVDENIASAVIFEDDVVPIIDDPELVATSLNYLVSIQDRLDIVALNNYQGRRSTRQLTRIDGNPQSDQGLGVKITGNIGAESYFITKQGAEKLLAHPYLFTMEIDLLMRSWWLHYRDFDFFYHSLSLFGQDTTTPSHIGYTAPHDFYKRGLLMGLLVFINRQFVSLKKRQLFPFYVRRAKARFKG